MRADSEAPTMSDISPLTGRSGSVLVAQVAAGLVLGLIVSLGSISGAWAATTFTVDSTADSSDAIPGDGSCDDGVGRCTLRAAIEEANAFSGVDAIHFAIGGTAPHTIAVLEALPDVTEALVIDATTQPGFAGTPVIELTRGGSFAADGLRLLAGDSTVRGLVVNSFRNGIHIGGPGGNVIEGNFIGTDLTGTLAVANSDGGVRIVDSPGNTIGGTSAAQANLISGNGFSTTVLTDSGIRIEGSTATDNEVIGNLIGTDLSGTSDLGNAAFGVGVAAPGNVIGGTEPGAGNVISGNGFAGVVAHGSDAVGNIVIGNRLGTDSDGLSSIPNGVGILIRQNAHSTTIGGTSAGAGNIISGNGSGIRIEVLTGFEGPGNTIQGNYIGVAADGTPLANTSRGLDVQGPNNLIGGTNGTTPGGPCTGACNVISSNGGRGILVWTTRAANNVIQGNYVGTDPTGTIGRGNGSSGIQTSSAGPTVIGGTQPGSGNLISANPGGGVFLGTDSHVLRGNLIGTDVTGTAALGNGFAGVSVGGSDNTVGGLEPAARNIISGNLGDGLRIDGGFIGSAGRNVVQGNFIGTDISGGVALPNSGKGVYVLNNSPDNLIGSSGPGAGNVISGNMGVGVDFFRSGATGNVLAGNLIGTDATGAFPLGNGSHGIAVNAPANIIGGSSPGEGNVVSGNLGSGIRIDGNETVIQGNLVGIDLSGVAAAGNSQYGIEVRSSGNLVGGLSPDAGNVISANGLSGVFLGQGASAVQVQGNAIGLATDGTTQLGNGGHGVYVVGSDNTIGGESPDAGNVIASNGGDGVYTSLGTGNAFLSNAIRMNQGLGIDLGPDGVEANDPGDGDSGANDLQNYPVITGAVTGTVVEGRLDSTATTTFHIEFFSNAELDPSGFGEGELFLGSTDVITDELGLAEFRVTLATTVSVGEFITATATNPSGSTSEFSQGQIVVENRPPDAVDDFFSVDEGGAVTGNVLDNDSDPDGHSLFVNTTLVVPPAHGEMTVTADGSATYTHDGSETTSDSVVYEVCDDGPVSLCSTATISITVVPVNDPPGAVDDAGVTDEDVAVSLNVLANDQDPEGDDLALTGYDAVSSEGGAVSCSTDGLCTYTPGSNFFGVDTFGYTMVDSVGLSDMATVTVDVSAVNDPPVASDDEATTDEDVTVTIDVLANDFDPDDTDLSVSAYNPTSEAGGSVDCTTDGSCSYQPPSGFSGTDRFGYTVADPSGATDMATVTLTVLATNTAPEIQLFSLPSEPQPLGVQVPLEAEFTDPDPEDAHTFAIHWGDGSTTTGTVPTGTRSITSGHTYAAAGVYTVTLTVSDGPTSDSEIFEFVVVYDPDGGFVTGGGWIDSPPGAYLADETLEGKASFGFVSKYRKGASTPSGNTEFQFRAGDFNFHSSTYEWLVVSSSDYARFKGVGTINGGGEYRFLIWAGDDDPDTFRIKIWSESDVVETVVYDNGVDQPIGGGSIVIHDK